MLKPADPDDYELLKEYDFSKMTVVAKGRYAPHRRVGKNVVLLEDDVAEAFPADEAVNEALREHMQYRDETMEHVLRKVIREELQAVAQ